MAKEIIKPKRPPATCPAFAAIRLKAASERPYFSSIIFSMVPVESEHCPTLAVDKWWRLYYNPNLLNILPIEESVSLLIHEIGHLIRNHEDRKGDRDHLIFNAAGDLAINIDIIKDNMKLPEGCFLPKMFDLSEDLTTEQYYDELMKKVKKVQNMLGKVKKGTGKGNCGSCAGDGGENEWEEKGEGNKSGQELTDKEGNPIPKVDKLSQELARRKTAADIVEHSKSRGTIPDGLLRWAKEKMVAKVNWKKELRSALTNSYNYVAGMTDYTRSRLSRRQSAYKDVMMYGFHKPVPNIAVIIDTSGSMSDKDLGQASSEVAKILKFLRGKVTVLSCDAAVNHVQKIESISQIKLSGGGGTDMPEGFVKANELKPRPDICICVTDGFTPWPECEYKFRTFAVLTREDAVKNIPRWIKVLPAFVTIVEDKE